jgi:predicted DNA-binding transcriptional regulator AlpA
MPKEIHEAARRVLLTDEAAKHVRLSSSSLEKARITGDGPPFIRIGSRRVAYLAEDLDRWLESRRRTSTSDSGAA